MITVKEIDCCCDRCQKKFVPKGDVIHKLVRSKSFDKGQTYRDETTYILCDECENELTSWLTEFKKPEPSEYDLFPYSHR